jgi:hypothetical protein
MVQPAVGAARGAPCSLLHTDWRLAGTGISAQACRKVCPTQWFRASLKPKQDPALPKTCTPTLSARRDIVLGQLWPAIAAMAHPASCPPPGSTAVTNPRPT